MTRRAIRHRGIATATVLIAAGVASILHGQDATPKPAPATAGPPTRPPGPPEVRAYDPADMAAKIVPLPLESIPDDPPPHEGAIFRIANRIEPPDILLVEALEALPGRPITGERLVRPDGTISLQFYGDVLVAGLTIEQAKAKIVLHLREYLPDQALGLVTWDEMGGLPEKRSKRPLDPPPDLPPPHEFDHIPPLPQMPPKVDAREKPEGVPPGPTATAGSATANGTEKTHDYFPKRPNAALTLHEPPMPQPPAIVGPGSGVPMSTAGPADAGEPPMTGGQRYIDVEPAKSNRVFVDITAYNSKVYYVLGDVGAPGRQAHTGHETVLDAVQCAGGSLPSADRSNIRLNRPARGEKPVRSYRIDLDAIERGEKKANLQLFPGDRLIIGRQGDRKPPVN